VSELVSQPFYHIRLTNNLTSPVVEKSRDHKSKGVGSIVVPHLYIIKEDGDPSLKLWAQTLLVEDRADQGESIVQWISKLREKVCLA
jgi:protein transport protein SEC24